MAISEYLQQIYDTFFATTSEEMKNAAQKLKNITPPPMNSMLEKQSKTDAIAKRLARSNMEVMDVPPTTPGTSNLLDTFVYILYIIFWSTVALAIGRD